jgi:hypothetical protein
MDARVQRAIVPEREALAELGQADEHEREQRAAVPGVQVGERVLVQEEQSSRRNGVGRLTAARIASRCRRCCHAAATLGGIGRDQAERHGT